MDPTSTPGGASRDRPDPAERPADAWTWRSIVVYAAVLAGLGVVLLLAGRWVEPPAEGPRIAIAYLLAFVFGAAVGATELTGRYRDRPLSAMLSPPGQLYMMANATAALAMVWLLHTGRLRISASLFGPEHPLLDALVLGGFGAMALFRSAVFTVRVRDSNVAVGPAAVLQEILRATDREADRLQARPRAQGVKEIMRGVVFQRAKDTLPTHCLNLMQNISPEERDSLSQAVTTLEARRISDEAKAYSLGLMLMNLVGERVLREAVAGLGERIRGPVADDPPILDRVARLVDGDLRILLELAIALAPEAAAAELARRRRETPGSTYTHDLLLQAPPGIDAASPDFVALALVRMRTAFGQETMAEAIKLLMRLRTKVVQDDIALDDLRGPMPPPAEGGQATAPGAGQG